ncbi:hypothetical protein [Pleomorphomonas oryzae]|uniref:hypothetical protein n=1 Tax=Pleomorphomonas oryzae TaxID=261934 RepID=UPI00041D81A1|nr:hypothetical protein [Pleomorphomonas oryzae]
MSRILLTGLWVCVVTLLSAYGAAWWLVNGSLAKPTDEPTWEGLQYVKTEPINVPMIRNGKLMGYSVLNLVFTADSTRLKEAPVPPQLFVTDEAFRTIYGDDSVDLDHIQRYDLKAFADGIRQKVNVRLKSDIVQEVLVDQISYFSRDAMKQ